MPTPASHAFNVKTTQLQALSGSAATSSAPVAPLPTRITRYRMTAEEVPVDFFADPDGQWEFSSLVEMAGFNPEHPGASVGALTQPFDGFPEGAAVVTEVGVDCRYVAIAQLPVLNGQSHKPSNRASARTPLTRAGSSRRPHRAA